MIMKDKLINVSFIVVIFVLAALARIALLPLESGDYYNYLSVWMGRIQEVGPWDSLSMTISNYSSAYMYIMCLLSGFSNSMLALKLASVAFDFVAAGVMFLLLHHLTGSKRKGVAAMAITLLCPTVIFNSAWWCQCDIIYCTFMLLSLLFLLKDRGSLCCIMLGLAFAFKVQAVFLLPFLVIMWLKGRTVKFWQFLWIPAVYFVIQIPAWIAGRPLSELMGVYFLQAGEFPFGTMHFPNIYDFLDETVARWHHMKEIGSFGLYFSLGVLGIFAYWMYSVKFRLTNEILVTMALFSVCLVLFTMPHMHERYGFFVDLLAIVYAIQRPEKLLISLGYVVISIITYAFFLTGTCFIPTLPLAFAMLALNVCVGMDLARQIRDNALEE